MKLKSLDVIWNNYTFTNDGIPPESYGGKAIFEDVDGSCTRIVLSASAVDLIMQTVAKEVAENARRMLAKMDEKFVRDSARPLSIAVDSNVEDGEIAF